MASAARQYDIHTAIPELPCDRPAALAVENGVVIMSLPDLGNVVLTADAALETAHRIMDAGLAAKRQAWQKPDGDRQASALARNIG